MLAGASIGVAAGIGGFTFVYAKAASYLVDDLQACANCHVMRGQYEGWQRGSHHAVATCNDCHTLAGFFSMYAVKASNGFFHSLYFPTGTRPDPDPDPPAEPEGDRGRPAIVCFLGRQGWCGTRWTSSPGPGSCTR